MSKHIVFWVFLVVVAALLVPACSVYDPALLDSVSVDGAVYDGGDGGTSSSSSGGGASSSSSGGGSGGSDAGPVVCDFCTIVNATIATCPTAATVSACDPASLTFIETVNMDAVQQNCATGAVPSPCAADACAAFAACSADAG